MKEAYTYLALGDSYTIGELVSAEERWPQQLVDALREDSIDIKDPKIIAVTGWTTDELKAGIAKANINEKKFDLVSLLIGVNNQYRGRDLENYRREFVDLLIHAIDFAGSDVEDVFVVSIPDWGVTPFAAEKDPDKIAQEIDRYNAIAREECEKRNIKFINITDISRKAGKDTSLNTTDGLHPSGKQYTLWLKRIYPIVKARLSQ